MPPSHAAREVLGCLAPCLESGPHQATAVRRRTRLTPEAFDRAVGELERTGLLRVRGVAELWLTGQGERAVAELFA